MKKTLLILLTTISFNGFCQFSQNFDAATTLPVGWTVLNGGGTTQTFAFGPPGGGDFVTAPNCAFIAYETAAHDDYLVTPQIVVTAGISNRISYYVKNQDRLNVESYEVKVSTTTATALAMTNVLLAVAPAPNNWTKVILDLTPYIGQSIYVGFHAVSADKFRLQFDNIVNEPLPSCQEPVAGLSTVNSPTQATLTWTSAKSNFEVLVQLASVAAPAANAPDGAGTNVVGTSYVATLPTANSSYSYYVRSECTAGLEFSTWAGPFNFNNVTTPDCATLTLPLNAAVDLPVLLVNSTTLPSTRNAQIVLSWTAPTTPVAGYRIKLGFNAASLQILNPAPSAPFTNLGVNITGILYNTTYYWSIVPETASGVQATNCPVFSFTTAAAPGFCMNGILAPTATYTPAVCNGTTANVITATPIRAGRYSNVNVVSGQTYTFASSVETDFMSLSTDGGLTSAGAGTTPYTWTSNFTGAVRVYVHLSNLCGVSATADTRTTTVVCSNNLATSTFEANNFKSYPSPIKDFLNLSYYKNISSVAIFNLLGQEVLSKSVNNTISKIDMSDLSSGAYLVKVTADNEVNTFKVIKE